MTKQTLHTPGPWTQGMKGQYETHNASNIYDQHGNSICAVTSVPLHCSVEELITSDNADDREGMANAHLIAAAPELLQALARLIHALETDGKTEHEVAEAQKAIAKATQSRP